MNNVPDYGFYFEKEGLAGHQGPINPSEEYFKHRQLEKAIAREMIQNSLDARRPGEPCVTVEFELKSVPTDAIPGITDLRSAAESAWNSNKDLQGAASLRDALASTRKKRVPVLRIGDFGTKGLTGSESVKNPTSPLSALTRGSGVSSTDGSRGGSFGIGSAVGFAASRMRTVCYMSKPQGFEAVYAASARFASHFDADDIKRVPHGYFTDLAVGKGGDFQYLRNPGTLLESTTRKDLGTDVFLLDYLNAADDENLSQIREAVIEDFMVAIQRGKLRVRGIGRQPWELNSETLKGFIDSSERLSETTLPYYRALTEGTLHTKELPHVGKVKLWIQVDPTRPHYIKSGTQLMRTPLMRVQTIPHRFNTPYSAVFICDDEKGNQLLREIEPPTHDEWSDKGQRSNKNAVRAIKTYIRDRLSESMVKEFGKELVVSGLENYLPSLSGAPGASSKGARSVKPRRDSPRIQESPAMLGKADDSSIRSSKSAAVGLSVRRSGVSTPEGDLPGSRGQRSGETGSKHDPKTSIPTKGTPGEGRSIIRPQDVTFRSFYTPENHAHVVTVKAEASIKGDLEITGLGIGSAAFGLPIRTARIQRPGSKALEPVDFQGSLIKGLEAAKGQTLVLAIQFHGNGRYRLGVADE